MSKIKYYTGDGQVYFETGGERTMNKEQKIQELTERIEKSQAEIDKLKEELEKLQKKSYEISYPEEGAKVYFISPFLGLIQDKFLHIKYKEDKQPYNTGLLFDTKEEAERFKRERALIKKIKCWAKEQQGDWKPDWSDINQCKYCVNIDRFIKEIICECCWGYDKLSKLPYFKSKKIAEACIDEFGDEILEVFC